MNRRSVLFAPGGMRLDAVDLEILRRLHEDARVQNQDLAGAVGLSPSACLQRIRRLEEAGAISHHSAVAAETIFSAWSILWVKVKLRNNTRPARQAFESAITTTTEVVEAHELVGRHDYLLRVALPAAAAWLSLLERIDPKDELIKRAEIIPGVRTVKRMSPHPLLISERP